MKCGKTKKLPDSKQTRGSSASKAFIRIPTLVTKMVPRKHVGKSNSHKKIQSEGANMTQ